MFKFIHAADIHLDSPLRGLERYDGAPVDEIRQATRRALENLVELAIDQSAAFLLVAGDLYDGDWKEFRTGLFFVSQMARLREAGIPVYVIAGNHDAANKMTKKLPLPDNVLLLSPRKPETVRLEDWDVAIHGQSFAKGAVLDNLACAYPAGDSGRFNIGLLHTSATGREGHEPYAPCTLDDLRARHYDYWALGHVHTAEIVCQDPPVVFPGNLQGRNIRETGPKGCVVVTVDDDHRVSLEPQATDVFRWEVCRLTAGDVETGYDLLDRVRERLTGLAQAADGRSLAVRVELSGACPAHRALAAEPHRWREEIRAVAQDIGSGGVWVEKVSLATSPPGLERQSLDGPVGGLVRYVEDIRQSPEKVASLAGELTDLRDKLPPELKEGPDALDFDRPERIREMLEQVEQLLVHQLLSREGAP
ncbi:MAG: DNA repair exonuclease [Pirellulales bacterium]|nr:DNA repair exonuclease [Pirellulales bacterium]